MKLGDMPIGTKFLYGGPGIAKRLLCIRAQVGYGHMAPNALYLEGPKAGHVFYLPEESNLEKVVIVETQSCASHSDPPPFL